METTISELQTFVKSVVSRESEWQNVATATSNGVSLNIVQSLEAEPEANPNDKSARKKRALSKKRWKEQHKVSVNASERDRKGRLSANIAKLKDTLPPNSNISMKSKDKIVEEAVHYIKTLLRKQDEILKSKTSETLFNELSSLKKKVADLENEVKRYRAILLSHGLPPVLNSTEPWKGKIPILPKRTDKSITKKKAASVVVSTGGKVTQQSVNDKTKQTAPSKVSEIRSAQTSKNSVGNEGQDTSKVVSDLPPQKPQNVPNQFSDFLNAALMVFLLKLCLDPVKTQKPKSPKVDHNGGSSTPPVTDSASSKISNLENSESVLVDKGFDSTAVCAGLKTPVLDAPKGKPRNGETKQPATPEPAKESADLIDSLPEDQPLAISANSPSIERPKSLQIHKEHGGDLSQISTSLHVEDNLLAWLHSSSVAASTGAEVLRSTLSPIHTQASVNLMNAGLPQKEPVGSHLQKRPTMNSFNIASLMKSNESDDAQLALPTNLLQRDKKESQPGGEGEGLDFNGNSKDALHQSFENDIFDCLQGFTTPEPLSRQGAGKLESFIRTTAIMSGKEQTVSMSHEGNRKRDQQIALDLHEIFLPEAAAQSQSTPVEHVYTFARSHNHQSVGQHGGQANLKIGYPEQAALQNIHAAPTSLWQPAIAETPQIKVTSAVNYTDCVTTPLPGYYSTPQRTQPGMSSSRVRNSQGVPANPGWFGGERQCSVNSTSSSNNLAVSAAQHTGQRKEQHKKRKAHKSPVAVKKKRSSASKGPQHSAKVAIREQHHANPNPNQVSTSASLHILPCPIGPTDSGERRMYPGVQNINPVVAHAPCVGYNPEIGAQSKLFHPHPALGQQTVAYSSHPGLGQQSVTYPSSHNPYFPYNHRLPQNQQIKYVPNLANSNNNNNGAAASGGKHHKGSQHHIRQILS